MRHIISCVGSEIFILTQGNHEMRLFIRFTGPNVKQKCIRVQETLLVWAHKYSNENRAEMGGFE